MSTLRAIVVPKKRIDLDEDNTGITVYGFTAQQIGELYASYPELAEVFDTVKLALAQAKARGEAPDLFGVVSAVFDKALSVLNRGGLALAVMFALREKPADDDEWTAAFEAANDLPVEFQFKILSESFTLTMPQVAANFRMAMGKVLEALSESGIASKTGSAE